MKFKKLLLEQQQLDESYKYYSFDWDDNIMTLPTKIWMTKNGKPYGASSEEFAKLRNFVGKGKDLNGNLWDLPKEAFKDFRPEGDAQFIKDVENPVKYGPVWKDFVECVNSGRIFSIITARGHKPESMKNAVKAMIDRNQNGLSKQSCIEGINEWRARADIPPLSGDEAINYYLNELCKFYPVSYEGLFGKDVSMSDPSKAKTHAMDDFAKHVKEKAISAGFKRGKEITMGFSDDDRKNFDLMANHMKAAKHGFSKVSLKYTGEEPEKKVLGKKDKNEKKSDVQRTRHPD
jgi:hypothetical protein